MDVPGTNRRGRTATTLLVSGVVSFVVAGLVAAGPASADKGGSSGAPPGNNATIKINNIPFDGGVNNEPHVTCPFRLSLYNFDSGDGVSNDAVVTFVAQPPSGKKIVLPPSTGESTFTFPGPDTSQDYSFDPVATLGQLTKHPIQGYHVKVTVEVTSTGITHGNSAASNGKANGKGKSNGNANANGKANGKSGTKVTKKHKVFWLTCDSEVEPTVTPTPTTSVLGVKHTRKPPTTQVKGVTVTRLPFTGISSRAIAVSAFAMVGFVLVGSGLLLLGRRPRSQLIC